MDKHDAVPGLIPMSCVVASAVEYMVDAGQRSVLSPDIRADAAINIASNLADTGASCLSFAAELVRTGMKLVHPSTMPPWRIKFRRRNIEIDLHLWSVVMS